MEVVTRLQVLLTTRRLSWGPKVRRPANPELTKLVKGAKLPKLRLKTEAKKTTKTLEQLFSPFLTSHSTPKQLPWLACRRRLSHNEKPYETSINTLRLSPIFALHLSLSPTLKSSICKHHLRLVAEFLELSNSNQRQRQGLVYLFGIASRHIQ